MKDILPRAQKPADGLQGEDKRQSALRDTRGGAYGVTPAGGGRERAAEQRTAGEDAQPGADVRPEAVVVEEDDLPEGLRRERKGPLNPSSGRHGSGSTER
jgi:hypothetical protein